MKASWRQRAACRGVDPDIFYPVSDDDAEEAKAVCASCTVRQSCLEYSLAAPAEGVWVALPSVNGAAFSASTASPLNAKAGQLVAAHADGGQSR